MRLTSIRSRFTWSYAILILLLAMQFPVVYVLIGGMVKKYSQVEKAADLRKRAVELSYLLNRNILNGESGLEGEFQKKKEGYGRVLNELRNGSTDTPAITDRVILAKLDVLDKSWKEMKESLDAAKVSGDALKSIMDEIENSTYPFIERLNEIVKGFAALNDASYSKNINIAGLQRMRTMDLAYLMERYSRSNYELDVIANEIAKALNEFDETFNGLKNGSSSLGLKAVKNRELLEKLQDMDGMVLKRKVLVLEGMKRKDNFYEKIMDLANNQTPKIMAATDELSGSITGEAKKSAEKGLLIVGAAVLASVSLALLFMWLTNNQVVKPITRISEVVEGFAKGDLTNRAEVKIRMMGKEIKDELTSLGESVDGMAGQMSQIIGRISDSSGLLASASEQLSKVSGQMSDGANRQSGQTAQAATAMEEMNSTVIEVAKNSQQVSESAKSARDIALNGGLVVKEAISAMREVSDSTSLTSETIRNLGTSSEKIGSIVSVINDIADQTNLLALNAAIEAARAGEQGRGFAVVADEVRKLAERTTRATREISEMIGAIQSETDRAVNAMSDGTARVEKGVKLANEAGEALDKIVAGVESVSNMITQIATSAEEQSSTTDEITRNMDSINEVAKNNVKAISESVGATNEVVRLAAELRELVANFKVPKTHGAGDIDDRVAFSHELAPAAI